MGSMEGSSRVGLRAAKLGSCLKYCFRPGWVSPLITERVKLDSLVISKGAVWIPAFLHSPVASKWEKTSTLKSSFHKYSQLPFYITPKLNKHLKSLSSWLYLIFVYRRWFPSCSLRNPNALFRVTGIYSLSSCEMLPGLFRISVLKMLGFPLMCLVAHPVVLISMCYLLAIPYVSIILLWMVICFAGQCLRPEISDFSHGP